MKKVATDYKGKHFVICDEDMIDDIWDYVDNSINVDWVIEHGLEDHVAGCLYYGIPPYHGRDMELKKRIEEIENKLNEA